MRQSIILKLFIFYLLVSVIFYSCRKDKGIDPDLAFKDFALFDSCVKTDGIKFYKNSPQTIYSGNNGPHGAFKLKFNSIANNALTDNGKLPVGGKFPENSMVIKEVIKDGSVSLYAIMYKRKGAWLWAEYGADSKVLFSVNNDPSVCINCHNQTGNRDLVTSFIFY